LKTRFPAIVDSVIATRKGVVFGSRCILPISAGVYTVGNKSSFTHQNFCSRGAPPPIVV